MEEEARSKTPEEQIKRTVWDNSPVFRAETIERIKESAKELHLQKSRPIQQRVF
jgi:hypothetical protein